MSRTGIFFAYYIIKIGKGGDGGTTARQKSMPILPESAKEIRLPHFVPVTQLFPDEHLDDVPRATKAEIEALWPETHIRPGDTVAVLVGSRGIADLDKIVKATLGALISHGAKPFIVPSMGSHAGGIAEEQKAFIAGYGITEETMGVPIRASMDTVIIGRTAGNVPVYIDKYASQADHIVPINRVKVHTDFDGAIESGLCKMLSIGIGKHTGCSRLHQEGFASFPTLLPEVAGIVIRERSVPFGVAIIENAHEHVHLVLAVAGSRIVETEPELLKISRALMPRLCFDAIDVLVVDQIGKDVTGAGMDPNITGRIAGAPKSPLFNGPSIRRIVVNRLSKGTHGNAIGIGLADFTTKAVAEAMNTEATYANVIASCTPEGARLPPCLDTEEEALRAALVTCQGIDKNTAKVVRIKDTLHLIEIEVSESLLPYCRSSRYFQAK